jgi:Gpi18-like mannosyltransferase
MSPASSRRAAWLIALAGTLLRLCIAPSYGYLGVDGDLIEHKQAVHLALTEGIAQVYVPSATNDPALTGREWQGGFFMNNLPLILYVRSALGLAYRHFEPRAFELWDWRLNYFGLEKTDLRRRLAASRGFTVLLKLPGILADAGLVLALALLAGSRGPWSGLAAAAAYAFNPAIVVDTAFWGQHDAVWVGLVVASVVLLSRDRPLLAGPTLALACLTKPQAWPLAPLLVIPALRRFPRRDLIRAACATAAVIFLLLLPFVLGGTLGASVRAVSASTLGGEAFVSCNAANLWWLVASGRGYEMSDAIPLAGPITPRLLGLALFLCVLGLVLRELDRHEARLRRLFLAAATVAMGFFTFATELHENHMMAVVPLLAFAAGRERRLWALLAALSATLLGNMALFDVALSAPLSRWLGRSELPIRALSLVLAALNVAAFVALSMSLPGSRSRAAGD